MTTYQEVESRLQRAERHGRSLRILDSCCNVQLGRYLAECRRRLELQRLHLGFARMKEDVLDDPGIDFRIRFSEITFT